MNRSYWNRKHNRAGNGKRRKLEELTRRELIGKLDRELSFYVRACAVIDDHGYARCITCSALKRFSDVDAGHYISRAVEITRFDLDNVWPQCPRCNRFQEGQKHLYRQNLVERIGESRVIRLENLARMGGSFDSLQLVEEIRRYRDLNKELRMRLREYQ